MKKLTLLALLLWAAAPSLQAQRPDAVTGATQQRQQPARGNQNRGRRPDSARQRQGEGRQPGYGRYLRDLPF